MKLVKRVRTIIISEMVFLLLLFLFMERYGYSRAVIPSVMLFQTGIMIYLAAAVYIPFKTFAETLAYFAQRDSREEEDIEMELKQVAGRVPYMEQIERLIDRFAKRRTRKSSAKIFDKQTELTALQSQINPHFLYNTLESIRGQALMDDNLEIAKMVEALAAFFRYSISGKGNLVTLRDELANINNYMLIQRYRFNNRFSMEIIIDEEDEAAYDFLIPRLIIQPVVENAIFHGLEEKLEGGKVIIEVIVTESNLIVTISDNGKGIESRDLKELNARIQSQDMQLDDGGSRQRNTGIALPNIHKRIQLLFGEEYGVNVYSTVGQGTDVEITVPAGYERGGGLEDEERNTSD
ncbi:sensor histidine kinase [Dorea sp. D27]|uniref:sensor histidine kinase n=1 Tax=Dorea sp. D27 TaxID=658665 RepID=UPI00067317E4|nr:sensor histidine kinase [Dorea sp. D27]KMZ54127.1 two-component sensor kinase YesM [Dorea sp. D27]